LSFDIDQRNGWPDELRVLLKQYPRETWAESRSPLAQFWLDKHDAFRRQSRALESATDDYRAERTSSRDFAIWIAPRLQSFISYLHGHHQIEDFHYFPAFRTAEPRLAAGFDTLAKDHEMLSAGINEVVEAVNQLILAIRDDSNANEQTQRPIGLGYADTSLRLYRRLSRHLDDEEDLIIPVMLDRG
jgi:hemerythrin-like domain-containing protein